MILASHGIRGRRSPGRILILTLLLLTAVASAPRAAPDRRVEAQQLHLHAQSMLERGTIEGRRTAIADLEQATLLDPGNPGYELALARVYYQVGFLKSARRRFERVVRMMPNDANGRFGLGQVWRRDWLKYLEPASLTRATDHFNACCRLRPGFTDSWLMLVPLLIEQHDSTAAYAAAIQALQSDERRPDALLALAYTAYHVGQLERADSAFDRAIPRMPKSVRDRFDDISPVASARDTFTLHRLPESEQNEFVRRFWKDMDPDLATPENEALLAYRARVAHAYFLFFNVKLREWDERGEVYVRYGPPEKVTYNPVGMNLNVTHVTDGVWSSASSFPANVLLWEYPSLGMEITLQDRTLSEYYMLPISMDHDPDPLPDADSLAAHGDQLASRSGRGVFPMLPPGVKPLDVTGTVARFETEKTPQLLAQIEVAGSPVDSQWVDWAVLDSMRHEVARNHRTLSPSACDPTTRRVADFATELKPGNYVVGITVRDAHGRRGVFREEVSVDPVLRELELSDVVVSCGAPYVGAGGGRTVAVRPEANPAARVAAGEPLTAYFEIYHLTPGDGGTSRFEYVYTVKPASRDTRIWLERAIAPRRTPDPISATRGEEQPGTLRRQFVSVPVQGLPPGRYRLEITVRDLVAMTEAKTQVEFVKTAEVR